MEFVDVVLRKVGRIAGRSIVGRLVESPKMGNVVVVEFPDGLHEYVTTPVKRILTLGAGEVVYLETANSRYRMEIVSESQVVAEAPAAT